MDKTPSFVDRFDHDIARVNGNRGQDYAHPLDNFRRTQHLKEPLREIAVPEIREAAEQIAVKLSRICHSPAHYDSWLDIAGYARTVMMILDRQKAEREAAEAEAVLVRAGVDARR